MVSGVGRGQVNCQSGRTLGVRTCKFCEIYFVSSPSNLNSIIHNGTSNGCWSSQ